MPECKSDERMFKRNYTLKKLKQMLCKLENRYYEKEGQIGPTLLVRAKRCVCTEQTAPRGERRPRVNLDGGEAFPLIVLDQGKPQWTPRYSARNQALTEDMGCYKATDACKERDMCCECEVAEGTHLHLPEVRDCSKALRPQCYAADLCTGDPARDPQPFRPNCDPNLYPNRWFPNITSACQYPRPCTASCFDQPDLNDWVVSKPSYTHYLQNRCHRQF